VVELICVEPIRDFEVFLTQTLRQNTHVKCRELLIGDAENISGRCFTNKIQNKNDVIVCYLSYVRIEIVIRDNQVDAVVSTLTLSSCRDVRQALREIRRILKPVSIHRFNHCSCFHHCSRAVCFSTWKIFVHPLCALLFFNIFAHLSINFYSVFP
jgi:SAM-dependent methyltransferase